MSRSRPWYCLLSSSSSCLWAIGFVRALAWNLCNTLFRALPSAATRIHAHTPVPVGNGILCLGGDAPWKHKGKRKQGSSWPDFSLALCCCCRDVKLVLSHGKPMREGGWGKGEKKHQWRWSLTLPVLPAGQVQVWQLWSHWSPCSRCCTAAAKPFTGTASWCQAAFSLEPPCRRCP